jgi:sigma-E factor negative regulatory protein RseA
MNMATDSADGAAARRERLSALVDGELDVSATAQACGAWRDDERARATWHAYQLIGDVLRSEDLAADPARDVAFLSALRVRLAAEPVVLAPAVEAASQEATDLRVAQGGGRARGRAWVGASAVAAGFVAVAGVLVLTRTPGVTPAALQASAITPPQSLALAAAASAQPAAPVATPQRSPTSAPTEPEPMVASGKLIRDARLDRYLAAHKQFAGTSALGVPSGFLRAATSESVDR